jgi:hypothetical protein
MLPPYTSTTRRLKERFGIKLRISADFTKKDFFLTILMAILRGASKIILKKANIKRTVTVRRGNYFFEFLKASIAVLFTL